MCVLATIEDTHLGLATEVPAPRPPPTFIHDEGDGAGRRPRRNDDGAPATTTIG